MSETAAYMALIETASPEGVQGRLQYLAKHGPHDMGWSYANILDVAQDMLLKNKRRRPVVEDGKLIGQITCRQLLTAVKKFRK